MIEIIEHERNKYAIIIRSGYDKPGPNFFTENDSALQVGSMVYKKGKAIEPHFHKYVKRELDNYAETLFVKKGKIKVNFYCPKKQNLIAERILYPNDVILIQSGAHGFEVLEDVEMVEVKLGPYIEDNLVRLKNIKL